MLDPTSPSFGNLLALPRLLPLRGLLGTYSVATITSYLAALGVYYDRKSLVISSPLIYAVFKLPTMDFVPVR